MAQTNSLGTYALMFGFLLLVGIAGLLLLGPALGSGGGTITVAHQSDKTAAIPDWLAGRQVEFPSELSFSDHSLGHFRGTTKGGQPQKMNALEIYELGQHHGCVASRRWCLTDPWGLLTELYLCVDPLTGLIGGLFIAHVKPIIGGPAIMEVQSGHARPASEWFKLIQDEGWLDCE